MNRNSVFACLLVFVLAVPAVSNAQLFNIGDLIRGGVSDANLLLHEYLAPLGRGFGADLNNNWYNSARPHKFLGLDITVMASAAIAPLEDETFDLSALSLEHVRLANPNGVIATPTVVGDDQPGPEVELFLPNPITGREEVIGSFFMPEGIGSRYVPSPMVQASVGLFLHTDVMLRFFPETKFGDAEGNIRLFGLGIKHDLKQWFAGGDKWPVDLAVMIGFTTLNVQSDELDIPPDPAAIPTGSTYTDQFVKIKASSLTYNLLLSKKLAILTLLGSVGYETSSLDLELDGTYPVTVIEDDLLSPNVGQLKIQDISDPIDISIGSANTWRASVGMRLNLLFLALHAGYTFSKYPVASAGIGLSIR